MTDARTPAGIYVRVSKDDGTQTTENQLPSLRRMAEARGFDIVDTYADEVSGVKGKRDRPELTRLFVDAARGKIRAVLVWALDRFSRDDTFWGGLAMVGELDHYRCALLSHEETWCDTSGIFREPLIAISLKIAASERARLIRRTKEGLARARLSGTKSGKAIGRPRAEVSDAMADRAAELYRTRVRSWRKVARLLAHEGFQNVPSHASVARAARARTKPSLELSQGPTDKTGVS